LDSAVQNVFEQAPASGLAARLLGSTADRNRERTACFHCGEPCPDGTYAKAEKTFCCNGCLIVHELLSENGLGQFYALAQYPGVRVRKPGRRERFAFLDQASIREQLVDFTDGTVSRVTLHIPGIHCVACVWLLENLFRLQEGIGDSRVNFARREVAISFSPGRISLSELVALLCSIGYEPTLTLGELGKRKQNPARRKQWLQVGLAAFGFGNIMLLSLPLYLGMDSFSAPLFRKVFGCLSLALAAPVVFYSAGDYWRSALLSLRQRTLTLDVPIALGLAALYAWSAYEILSGHGEGYLDSLTGLVFLLLCGRVFQKLTNERLAFDRDYKCFFPLAVTRKAGGTETSVSISDLRVGDRIVVRNGELIPADARLRRGQALIDYSFVTGEADPVSKAAGDYVYAGGRQAGEAIELETVKPVSQGYLTSLWDHRAFRKESPNDLNCLTNRYSRRFTVIVLAMAVGAALGWLLAGQSATAVKAFASVLIVACPCALALAAPFTFGTAQRLLARTQTFLKNALVLERMAQVDTILFDKTGTLTAGHGDSALVHAPVKLSAEEQAWVLSLARQSTHPLSIRLAHWLSPVSDPEPVLDFAEIPGCGIRGRVRGRELLLGSAAWLEARGVSLKEFSLPGESHVCLAIDGRFRCCFAMAHTLRPDTEALLKQLAGKFELALLSGDTEKERDRFRKLFGANARLCFNQSPLDKLGFVETLQKAGRTVMMVGDGLNDAGALKQSDVGVAVVEKIGVFSPASDVILEAAQAPRLFQMLSLARKATRIVRVNFALSAAYNLIGISIAASGALSPLFCAILMPLSSVTVVLFACGATNRAAKKVGLALQSGGDNSP
jgi:Cu+-exporting ATPase